MRPGASGWYREPLLSGAAGAALLVFYLCTLDGPPPAPPTHPAATSAKSQPLHGRSSTLHLPPLPLSSHIFVVPTLAVLEV